MMATDRFWVGDPSTADRDCSRAGITCITGKEYP